MKANGTGSIEAQGEEAFASPATEVSAGAGGAATTAPEVKGESEISQVVQQIEQDQNLLCPVSFAMLKCARDKIVVTPCMKQKQIVPALNPFQEDDTSCCGEEEYLGDSCIRLVAQCVCLVANLLPLLVFKSISLCCAPEPGKRHCLQDRKCVTAMYSWEKQTPSGEGTAKVYPEIFSDGSEAATGQVDSEQAEPGSISSEAGVKLLRRVMDNLGQPSGDDVTLREDVKKCDVDGNDKLSIKELLSVLQKYKLLSAGEAATKAD